MNNRTNQDPDQREQGTFERIGEQIGGAAGQIFGRGGDVATDLVSSMLGSTINRLGEWWSSTDANRAARSFTDREDRACRQHFEAEPSAATTRDYADVRPLYQFGHVAGQNPEYQGRDFSEIEPDLQRAWDEESRRTHGDWPEVRGYVGFGYSQDHTERDV